MNLLQAKGKFKWYVALNLVYNVASVIKLPVVVNNNINILDLYSA